MRIFNTGLRVQLVRQRGFTIVELLIVIVVIGILAAITIIAYNGVVSSAAEATLKSDLRNVQAQVAGAKETEGSYPADTSTFVASPGTVYEYDADETSYCITASSEAAGVSFYFDSSAGVIAQGTCPGHSGIGGVQSGLALASGNTHSCQLDSGNAYCWGYGPSGEMGVGVSQTATPLPVTTSGVLSGRTVTQISRTCALADGQVFCWGPGGFGQLGDGLGTSSSTPVAVSTSGVLSGRTVTAISSGGFQSCALADGQAFCWGAGGYTGDGTATTRNAPVAVSTSGVLSGRTVTAISSGYLHTCAIADGQAFCWGGGTSAQLGNGASSNSNVPVAVSTAGVLAGKTVTAISAGGFNTCAIADGEVFCWGTGTNGMLGNAASSTSNIPVAVSTSGVLSGRTVTAVTNGYVSSGSHPNCAIADGEAFCWGLGTSGQLGNNASSTSNVPVAVSTSGVLSGLTVTDIAPSSTHTCAIANDSAYCWGSGSNGRLGNGTTTTSLIPVAVSPLPS
jgi:prepilin-type N-terminal cleavage/methylation domain-containing protein